jgi:nitrate/nitrite transport system substrate-binding protein
MTASQGPTTGQQAKQPRWGAICSPAAAFFVGEKLVGERFGDEGNALVGCRTNYLTAERKTTEMTTNGKTATKIRRGLDRRTFLKTGVGTAALLGALRSNFPAGVHSAEAAGPETTKAALGFIALTDAAPLFVAKEKGLFAKYGMADVEVQKQASWGTTRDNLVLGSEGNGIDGAHILTPMPYLISAGKVTQNNVPTPMYIMARLNLNGQCISVSKEYNDLKVGLDTARFKAALEKKKASGKAVKAAMTFPGGTHDLWIRYWLAAGRIDPDKNIDTIVVPPPQMVANMKVGTMDCFCVCEPWNLQLIHQEVGYTAITTGELWNIHPEKSLGLRAAYVDKNPKAAMALLMAVMEAQQWCEKMDNREEAAAICAKRQWMNCPVEDVTDRMKGKFDYGTGRVEAASPHIMRYWKDQASYPFQSHDLWFITEDIRWGKYEAGFDAKTLIKKVNREDLWREAAKSLGVAAADIPASTSRGKETFFDGKVFDPDHPDAYLKSLSIKRVEV